MRCAESLIAASVLLILAAGPSHPGTGDCFVCHANRDFAKVAANGQLVSLFVSPKRFSESSHKTLACTRCHTDFSSNPHAIARRRQNGTSPELRAISRVKGYDPVVLAACIKCHRKEFEEYRGSIHGEVLP